MALTLHYDGTNNTVPVGPIPACTRAGTDATRFNSSGVLETVAADTIRHNHDVSGTPLGWLVEEARTNIALHNNDWTDAVYAATNITAVMDATGPDNVANSASTLTADANSGTITQAITVASAQLTTSVWMKRVTGTGTVEITDNAFTNATDVTADINSSTWSKVGDITRTQANPVVGIRLGTSGDVVEVSYLQTEAGAASSSPIGTGVSTVTRPVDIIKTTTMTWLGAASGSMYIKLIKDYPAANGIAASANTGSNNNFIRYAVLSSKLNFQTTHAADDNGAIINTDNTVAGVAKESASAYADDDIAGYFDGADLKTDATAGHPLSAALTEFSVGSRNGLTVLNGHVQEIRYYDERLANSVLQLMSSGTFPTAVSGAAPGIGLGFGKMGKMGA